MSASVIASYVLVRFERLRPVDGLEIGFQLMIVGTKQRREPRGVARAAEILHQQGIEQRRTLVGRQPNRFRDSHADQAGARRVARPLAFSQIERERQPTEHLREPDIAGICHVQGDKLAQLEVIVMSVQIVLYETLLSYAPTAEQGLLQQDCQMEVLLFD